MGIRNPFLFRATEQKNEDDLFIELFSEDILSILDEHNADIFIKPLILRSSPGFGKTSLLKLFSAQILKKLVNYHLSHSNRNELLNAVKKLGFIDENNEVSRIGIYIPCNNVYMNLYDISFDEIAKSTSFFALINSKIIFEFVQSIKVILTSRVENYNEDLVKITINEKTHIPLYFRENYEKEDYTLKDFYDYAILLEREILNYIDNFGLMNYDKSLILANLDLDSVNLISNCTILYESNPINLQFLLMFDDLHKLSEIQRELMYKIILNDRLQVPIWIAERLSILKDNSIFFGTTKSRDYINIHLEDNIRRRSQSKKIFSNFLKKLTIYRMGFQRNNIASFEGKLSTLLENIDIRDAINLKKEELNNSYSSFIKYKNLLDVVNNLTDNDISTLIRMHVIGIYIERTRLNEQPTFDLVEIDSSTINEINEKEIKPAAEYFTMIFSNLPYFYSFDKIIKLASYNTEQFLGIASSLYEEMLARSISGKDELISPRKQENIIKTYADNKWNEIRTNIKDGHKVQKFLDYVLSYSKKESIRPNAPYSPSVTGFAISTTETKKLTENKHYRELRKILMLCISYNLLSVEENKKQGSKQSETLTLFYFNRWLCVKYGLSIGYGGWRRKKIEELNKIIIRDQNDTDVFILFKD